MLRLAEAVVDDVRVDSFGDALLASLVIAAVTVVLDVILGTNDDDAYTPARHPATSPSARA